MEHFGKFLHGMKEAVAKVRGKFIDHCNQMSGRKCVALYVPRHKQLQGAQSPPPPLLPLLIKKKGGGGLTSHFLTLTTSYIMGKHCIV